MSRSPADPARLPRARARRLPALALTALTPLAGLAPIGVLAGCATGDDDPTEEALERTLDDLGLEPDGTLADPAPTAPSAAARPGAADVETTYGRLAEDFPDAVPIIDGRVDLTVRTGPARTAATAPTAGPAGDARPTTWLVAVRTGYTDPTDLRAATREATGLLVVAGYRFTEQRPGRPVLDDGTWRVALTPEWTGEQVALTYSVAPSGTADATD